jgi:hypothetical protein
MKQQPNKRQNLISIPDLSIQTQQAYLRTYNRCLRGEYGKVERIDGRLFVVMPDFTKPAA